MLHYCSKQCMCETAGQMAMEGFYKRPLPSPPAIDFASDEGKKLFKEAMLNGTMVGFFKLISHFQTQSEPAYCGLASLAVILNALAIDPCRKWKGPWRWFDESMLDCCEPLEKVKATGISFGKVVCLAHCAGAKVEAFHTNQSSIDRFRKSVVACTTSDDCHLISSYHRGVLKQTGTGHFSPIGGYHTEKDMVLILDVARFKYPPHWVELSLLWEAMDTVLPESGLRRGFMLISRHQEQPSLLFSLSCKEESWINTAKHLMDDVPLLLSSDSLKSIRDILSTILFTLPSEFAEFITWVINIPEKEFGVEIPNQENNRRSAIKEVLKLVRMTDLHEHVLDTLFSEKFLCEIEQFFDHRDYLVDMAASETQLGSLNRFFSRETLLRFYSSANGNICGKVGLEKVTKVVLEQGVDVLTILLLALPSKTWSGIKDHEVLSKMVGLVSSEGLPKLLREEIFYFRNQLFLIKKCNDKCCED